MQLAFDRGKQVVTEAPIAINTSEMEILQQETTQNARDVKSPLLRTLSMGLWIVANLAGIAIGIGITTHKSSSDMSSSLSSGSVEYSYYELSIQIPCADKGL